MPFTVEDSHGLAVPAQIAAPRRETADLRRSGEQLRTEVAELHRHMVRRFDDVQVELEELTADVGQLKEYNLERRHRERGLAYFGSLIRKGRVLTSEEVSDLLEDAEDRGVLSRDERLDVAWAEVILSGERRTDRRPIMVLAEVSSDLDRDDVLHATGRAAMLARLGTPVLPAVAGITITERAAAMAHSRNVWQILDGHAIEPLVDAPATPRWSTAVQIDTIGTEIEQIPVSINYDIIRLFSEGLYKSPHKAVEELVSNAYDADARRVHVLLPEAGDDPEGLAPLWVIDNGHGMNEDGFRQLWRVADSTKNGPLAEGRRAPIGQFGIGKLASYVLAWKLTHVSYIDGRLLLTAMDFHNCTGRQSDGAGQVDVALRQVDEAVAKTHLEEITQRDPAAWEMMFGPNRSPTWTAAGLSDFKELYSKLVTGTLRWVLSTGLPLYSDFVVSLNGDRVSPSRETKKPIRQVAISDTLPDIGEIRGTARIYEQQLTSGKSEQYGRSHGFFVRVRGRVINLEDDLFGIEAVNHAAWSRFALEVHADGLRRYLLSSREGVRDCDQIRSFRKLLLEYFNDCRSAYEEWDRRTNAELEITGLLSDSHSIHITEPLVRSVRSTVEAGEDSFYIDVPSSVKEDDRSEWLEEYESNVSERPIDKNIFERQGPDAPALRYDPVSRRLVVNLEHPFVDKLTAGGRRPNPAKLFAASELFLEGQLQVQGISPMVVSSFLRDRDRVLRLAAGSYAPPTALEVLRLLEAAGNDSHALERAVGAVFRVLGFEYERKGGNRPGPDGILIARLGRLKSGLATYSIVYDAKQTNQPSVPADKVDIASLEDFRAREKADFGFFIATAYAAETDPNGVLNKRIVRSGKRLTLLKVEHLHRLVLLHYTQGITLIPSFALFLKRRTR